MKSSHPIVHGASGSAFIRFDGNIDELVKILSDGLMIPNLELVHRKEPPGDMYGSAELMGFGIDLDHSEEVESFHYIFTIETECSSRESFHGNMHDLSLWLARFISSICALDTLASGTRIVFKNGQAQEPIEG